MPTLTKREQDAKWRNTHPIQAVLKTRQASAVRRFKAYALLGGKCAICGTDDPMVLEFNHKNGGGNRHREEVGAPMRNWVIHNPEEAREKLELLCANCHRRLHSSFNILEGYAQLIRKR